MSRHHFAVRATMLAVGLMATISISGCFTTVIKNGAPPVPATAENDGKWHSGLIDGIAELSGPYDLSKMCPGGWAEIKTETSFLNGLVQTVTYGIYSPQSVTVRCAGGVAPVMPAPAAPPPGALPPAAPPPAAPTPSH